jgi:ATP-dependent DNA helicase RecG
MFSEKPERFFPYSRVEIVFFPNGAEDPEFKEIPAISGPVPYMIKETLSYLKTHVLEEKIRKVANQPESIRVWNYPYTALEEAVANALYHRDYQLREPVEIRIYPNSITILNYGGPDRSIKPGAFNKDIIKPRRYRNRRLGDFLKELDLTEGRATGIPTIRKALIENGSPLANFETDDDRSFFETTLFIHADFIKSKKSDNVKENKISEQIRNKFGTNSEQIRKEFGKNIGETFSVIVKNPSFTAEQIANKTSKTPRTIENHISKLRDAGFIERKGAKIGGYWEIITESRK